MTLRYLVDGEVVPADRATVDVRDRGFLYGDAAFETLRVYNGSLFAWPAHHARLEATCEVLSLEHGLAPDRLRGWVHRALEANDLEEAAVRLSITRGVQPGVLTPDAAVDPTVVVIVRPLGRGGLGGTPTWDAPAATRIVETEKVPDAAIPASAKTHNYLSGVLARLELGPDEDEAIMLDADGLVTEGTTSNLFVVDDGTLVTPPLSRPVLPGVTREGVLALAEALGIPTAEADLDPERLRAADEAFLTNTTAEVWPVATVDGEPVGGGPVTDRLARAFRGAVEAHHYG